MASNDNSFMYYMTHSVPKKAVSKPTPSRMKRKMEESRQKQAKRARLQKRMEEKEHLREEEERRHFQEEYGSYYMYDMDYTEDEAEGHRLYQELLTQGEMTPDKPEWLD